MTHPLTNALAMRTAAAKAMGDYHWQRYADKKDGGKLSSPAVFTSHTHQHVMDAILALPLEADHAALLAEAVRLPEIAALVEAATEQAEYLSLCGEDGDLLRNLLRALQPFAALVQP